MIGKKQSQLTLFHVDLLHAVQGLEEGTPEHVPGVLAIGDAAKADLLLQLNNILDGLLLDGNQRVRSGALVGDCVAFLNEFLRTQQGANVLSAERRVAGRGRHIDVYFMLSSRFTCN
jgi:hypothetical protein